jgi:hypothetical protein
MLGNLKLGRLAVLLHGTVAEVQPNASGNRSNKQHTTNHNRRNLPIVQLIVIIAIASPILFLLTKCPGDVLVVSSVLVFLIGFSNQESLGMLMD